VGSPAGAGGSPPHSGRWDFTHRIYAERVRNVQNPYEKMYYLLAAALANAETLLEETLETVYKIPSEAKNRDQIATDLLSAQMQNVIDDLRNALSGAEDILLDAPDET